MACQLNDHRLAGLKRAHTGGTRKRFESWSGWSKTTSASSEARETLPESSMSQTQPCCFGSESTALSVEPYRRHDRLSVGVSAGRTIPCGTSGANSTRDGWAVSRQSDSHFTQARHGSARVPLFGVVTMRPAKDVDCIGLTPWTCRSTFTTSRRLPSRVLGLIRRTWCSSVKRATSSFIHGGM